MAKHWSVKQIASTFSYESRSVCHSLTNKRNGDDDDDNDDDNNTDRGSGPLVSLNAMTYLIVGNKDNGETKSRSRRQCRGELLVRALALRCSRPALTTGSTSRPLL